MLANYYYDVIRLRLSPSKKKYLPKILSDVDSWTTSNGEVYFYEKDPQFSIKINEGADVLSDRFKKFPDKNHDTVSWVEVKCGEAVLFGWNFMHLDGYRFLVPVPKTELDPEKKSYDFYNLNNLEFKVFNVIGMANLMGEKTKLEGLEKVAQMLNIEIIKL